jgi:hypothetical protein
MGGRTYFKMTVLGISLVFLAGVCFAGQPAKPHKFKTGLDVAKKFDKLMKKRNKMVKGSKKRAETQAEMDQLKKEYFRKWRKKHVSKKQIRGLR